MLHKDEPTLSTTENFLLQCFSDLLQDKQIGLQDNLFNKGLDSVTAAMFINRVRDEFKVELPIFRVFETPTIDALALEVQDLQQASKHSRQKEEN